MKNFLLTNYINRANKLNSRKMASMDQTVKDAIIERTAFLHVDASLKERMFCILHDVEKPTVCAYCGSQCRFIHARNYYVLTCGSHVCSAKLRIERKNNSINKNNDL